MNDCDKTAAAQSRATVAVGKQLCLLLAFWAVGEATVRVTGLPLSGAVLGLALLVGLLGLGWVDARQVKRGADWLLADMLLFFVPAVLAVVDHRELLGLTGLKVLLIILTSTALVMTSTVLVIQLCLRERSQRTPHRPFRGGLER